MSRRKTKFYRCHSTHDQYLYNFSQFYQYTVNHVKNNIIFPVLSVIVYISLHLIHIIGSESCHSKNEIIAYPSRGIPARTSSAGGEGDRMSAKKITSTNSHEGERKYKGLLPSLEGVKTKVEKLKPKALKAQTRKILKEEKDDSPFNQFLPKGNKNKRRIIRHVTRLLKKKVYKYLDLPVRHNCQWSSESILDLVLYATVRNSCIEDASNSLNLRKPRKFKGCDVEIESVPNGDTVLRRIQKIGTEEWMERFEKANTDLLRPFKKAKEFSGFTWLSLDITPVNFFGNKNTRGIMGKKREGGTSYAYKYMDICVSAQDQRVTLAGSYMVQLQDHQKLMKKLIKKALKYVHGDVGFYCDREFGTVPYLTVLEKMKVSWVVAIKKNPRINKIIKETSEYPRVVWYVMGQKEKVGFSLILIKNKKGEIKCFGTNMPVDEKTCIDLVEGYRQRWSIETSHRMIHDMRARTCSKNFSFRWFLVLFAMLVRNAYYLLNKVITGICHVTLKIFAELVKENRIKDILKFEETISVVKVGDG